MHEKIAAIFDEHAAPEHCCRARTHAAAKPLGAFAASMQRQLTRYRELLMDAETHDELPDAFRGKLEFMHQTLGAGERVAGEVVKAARDATAIMAQLDRVFGEAKTDLEKWEAAEAAKAATGLPQLPSGDGDLFKMEPLT